MLRRPNRAAACAAVLLALVLAPAATATGAAGAPLAPARADQDLGARGWVWPLAGLRIVAPYRAPVDDYAPGHRGVDLAPADSAAVRSPAAGVVAFAGAVAGRGVLTIDHGDGLVTTLEPLNTDLRPGDAVLRGAYVGDIALGGHAAPGTLHFGVRLDGRYINPLLLLGGVPRAVLLPCCE